MASKIGRLIKEKKKTERPDYTPRVPALEQACRVLLCLEKGTKSRMTLTEICKEVGIHKSKGYSILNVLQQFGFAEKNSDTKAYSLGIGLIFLSRHVLDHMDYQAIINPFLRILTEETNGTACFGLVNREYLYITAKYEARQNLGITLRLGHRFHFTFGAHGKAIVAFMSDDEREKVLAGEKLYFYGERTKLSMKRLRDELARCKKSGYSVDPGELQPGINAVSSPVFGIDGNIVGCITLIGTFPQSLIDKYGQKTASIAKQVSHKFGADVERLYEEPKKNASGQFFPESNIPRRK
jgi:DNA-binding IclR family transcriptional regulator